MIENDPSNVFSAFEILLEEIEAEIDFVNNVGAKSFESRDYDRAREALEQAGKITAFRGQVIALRTEWERIAAEMESREDEETKVERQDLGRLRRGLRTPERDYQQPILEVLAEMGGSGETSTVLDRVGERMKSVLKKVDYDVLASSSDMPRWRNAAQWARNAMVQDGLLKQNSPRGTWELSEKGWQAVRERK
ncbi:MAG: winged helix-turn-helix domain-containing protein [Candidatus Zixiibacteriota bacterium]